VTITHHLDDATILAFAAGTLGEAHGIVVAAHMSSCSFCRANLRSAEILGGAILAQQPESAVSDLCRSATLASLDSKPSTKKNVPVLHGELPPALARALGGKSLSDVKWHKKAPGVATFDVPLANLPKGDRTHLKLLRIGTGRAMPEHGHGGEELTLILKGSYTDHMGKFSVGDVADLDEDIEHQPVVDSLEDCICLVATEAPTRFKSIWARLAQPFVGI
jgi:putative transcriptional regulator